MKNETLHKSDEKVVSGVCGGIANYLNIDPTIVRAGWAGMTVVAAPAAIATYVVASMCMDNKEKKERAAEEFCDEAEARAEEYKEVFTEENVETEEGSFQYTDSDSKKVEFDFDSEKFKEEADKLKTEFKEQVDNFKESQFVKDIKDTKLAKDLKEIKDKKSITISWK